MSALDLVIRTQSEIRRAELVARYGERALRFWHRNGERSGEVAK